MTRCRRDYDSTALAWLQALSIRSQMILNVRRATVGDRILGSVMQLLSPGDKSREFSRAALSLCKQAA
jgi:hypothetical protein